MRKRPPTKMMRIRTRDLERMKELAKQAGMKLPDFQRALLKQYNRRKK